MTLGCASVHLDTPKGAPATRHPTSMSWRVLAPLSAVVCGAVLAGLASAAAPTTSGPLRIYDPEGDTSAQLTIGDVFRASVKVVKNIDGRTYDIVVDLRPHGSRSFATLTRALALRGAKLHWPQTATVLVNGKVVGHQLIDYTFYPHGVGRVPEIEFGLALTLARATSIAHVLRGP
jgi:hypothetical protein